MKTFDIFEDANGEIAAVKLGFSWPAFTFTWMWCFARRLYFWGCVTLGVTVVATVLEVVSVISRGGGLLLNLGVHGLIWIVTAAFWVWFAWAGNGFRRSNLIRRGYSCKERVSAVSRIRAIGKYGRKSG